MTTPSEAERLLVEAAALLAHARDVATSGGTQGLAEGLRGIPPMPKPVDDGRPIEDRHGPNVFPTPDDADRALRNLATYARRIRADSLSAAHILSEWRRLGLPHNHPDRKPSKDERLVAEGENIDDDDVCPSCIRIGFVSPRQQRRRLCGWCYSLVNTYRDRWPNLAVVGMPPVELVRLHHDAFLHGGTVTGGEVERRLAISHGTPKKGEEA